MRALTASGEDSQHIKQGCWKGPFVVHIVEIVGSVELSSYGSSVIDDLGHGQHVFPEGIEGI